MGLGLGLSGLDYIIGEPTNSDVVNYLTTVLLPPDISAAFDTIEIDHHGNFQLITVLAISTFPDRP